MVFDICFCLFLKCLNTVIAVDGAAAGAAQGLKASVVHGCFSKESRFGISSCLSFLQISLMGSRGILVIVLIQLGSSQLIHLSAIVFDQSTKPFEHQPYGGHRLPVPMIHYTFKQFCPLIKRDCKKGYWLVAGIYLPCRQTRKKIMLLSTCNVT